MRGRLSNFYYSISMKKKWIIFIAVILIYEIVLIGYFGYKNYEKVISNHFIKSVQNDVSNVAEQVEENLKSLEEFSKKLQYDEYIYNFIQEKEYSIRSKAEEGNITSSHRSMPEYEFKKLIERHLHSIILSRPEITLASIQFTEEPEYTYTVTRKKSYADEIKFREANIFDKKQKTDSATGYYINKEKELYLAQKIINRTSFKHSATIILKVDAQIIFEKFEKMLEGAKMGVYVIGLGNKEILLSGEVSNEYKTEVLGYLKEDKPPDIYLGENPKKEFIVYDKINISNQEIGVAVLIFTNILFQEIRASLNKIIIFSLLTIPIFMLFAYKLYKDLIQPIYFLSEKMGQIEHGEMGVLVDSGRGDEIGILFRSFNRMSQQINYLVNRVYKEQLAFKNSEIRALQAQINPHFLYNTLEIINWTARMEGADDVAEMIEALGGIMEINIDRKSERFLTVEEELKYTNHYIFLIKKRFGEKIQFHQKVSEQVFKYKVPRLILQPLIENAIEHGLEPVGKGIVKLKIDIEQDHMIIEIHDNGCGMTQETLSRLQYNLDNWNQVASEKVESTSRGKIGVLNVHSRLKLIYGGQSGVEVVSQHNEGTLIKLRIPIIEQDA